MGSFNASLRTLGDRRGLPATVTLGQGRISIEAGEHSIGEWSLDEVHLENTGTGYRMAAEGEQIILEIQDAATFEIELRAGESASGGRKARRAKATRAAEASTPEPKAKAPRAAKTREKAKPAPPARRARADTPSLEPDHGLGRLDRVLSAAERKWGSLLPDWVFTRRIVWIGGGLLVLTILLPGLVSTVMLIGGLILVLLGAVVYTDQVLAAKWLPGRMSPMHVLITGIGVLMVGIIVGTAA